MPASRPRARRPLALALGLAAALAALPAGSPRAEVARIELHPFASASPTDQQFLTGQRDANPVTIAGELRIPRPGTDRLPAVVLLHGSSGIGGNVDLWAREITDMGAAAFVVDSFTGRGLANLQADQDRLSRLAGVVDAYRALELLANHPRIDPARIAVMGFSRGGGAAHWAALNRFRAMHGRPDGPGFAGFLAFYPTCDRVFRDGADVADRPIRIVHGTADDYIPIAGCRAYVERLRQAGRDIALVEIAGAHHVFDNPLLPATLRVPAAQKTQGCPPIEEAPDGRLVNGQTRQPFTYAADPCVERGVTVGHDAGALATARGVVREFLASVLQPR